MQLGFLIEAPGPAYQRDFQGQLYGTIPVPVQLVVQEWLEPFYDEEGCPLGQDYCDRTVLQTGNLVLAIQADGTGDIYATSNEGLSRGLPRYLRIVPQWRDNGGSTAMIMLADGDQLTGQ